MSTEGDHRDYLPRPARPVPSSYKCPHCGAMHVDARERPACQVWRETHAPTTQDQRIRDLEREVERLRAFVALAASTCGMNNCNCPTAPAIREALAAIAKDPQP